jgi:hypothetical protein
MLGLDFFRYFRSPPMNDSQNLSYQKHMLQRQAEVEFCSGTLKTMSGTFLKIIGARRKAEKHLQAAEAHWLAAADATAQKEQLIELTLRQRAQGGKRDHFADSGAIGKQHH